MTSMPEIKVAGPDQKDKVLALLCLAFAADPFMRWLLPEADRFLSYYNRFTLAIAGQAFDHGSAFYTADWSAASLWRPPGVGADDDMVSALVREMVPNAMLKNMAMLAEETGKYVPAEPHWYLADIGVDVTQQGRGLGALLMKDMLQRCDLDKLPAYLESSNPKNLSFYERHGFAALGEINVGNPQPITPMLRTPR